MQRICVFCGSNRGSDPRYQQAAADLGALLAERGQQLVFGGGQVGLMGVIADATLAAGGTVIGVIPEHLATKELLHTGVTTLYRVDSMHARKAKMAEQADAFVALPGGYGTLEELLEIITWAQLGIHRKPIGILNVAGFFDGLVQIIDHAITEGFIKPQHKRLLVVSDSPTILLDSLQTHDMPTTRKWIRLDET